MDAFGKLWANVDTIRMLQSFIESSTAAEVICGTDGIIVWCNDKFTLIHEQPREDLIGSHFGEYVVYPKGGSADDRIKTSIENGRTELQKAKWITKSGKEKFMHQRLYRLDDIHQNHIGFWGIAYELTEEKKSIDDSKTAIRVLTEMHNEDCKKKQLEVIEMIKSQSNVLCPGKNLRGKYCPAILAVEEFINKGRPAINNLLTKTELKVADYAKQGESIKTTSMKMSISQRTVKNHRHSIRKKLNITHTNISLTNYLQDLIK
jgi:PAS domain S-box-containing protein